MTGAGHDTAETLSLLSLPSVLPDSFSCPSAPRPSPGNSPPSRWGRCPVSRTRTGASGGERPRSVARKPARSRECTPEARSPRITDPPETSRQPGAVATASMGAEHQTRLCLASCGPATPPALLELLRMLQRFAGASGRRCQEQSLAQAGSLLPALSQAWAQLAAPEAQPFLRCLLSCQLEATGSLGAFRKLEKIVATLAAGRESVASEEVAGMLGHLTQGQQALTLGELRTVCLFLEESSLAREHWRHALGSLLGRAASTLASVLRDPAAGAGERACHAVKLVLQLFQSMPEEVGARTWSPAGGGEPLASILQSLVQVVLGKVASKDARLLAGTALGMLVNAAPTPEAGAGAVSQLLRLLGPDPGEQRLGGLRVAVPPMNPDGLEDLVLSRGLLTSCRKDILTFRPPGGKACLLLGALIPPVGPGWSEKNMDYRAFLLQAFLLWLRRLHESTPGIWMGRLLSGTSQGALRLTQFIWSNTESPVGDSP
ncbi:uncharacterized protein LOC127548769 [Antechinus flavipes]|uniref:uncharacterized protein LOC127548769 n=1 Tax=Antechinus flavipes TaxID=38775 RepID=UPI002235CF9A|nr:uncharacterized protein LOC127548769 [Antechinus flavipes]